MLFISGIFLLSLFQVQAPAFSATSCGQLYSSVKPVPSSEIRFTQDFLGRDWAEYKYRKLRLRYSRWKKTKAGTSKADFIKDRTLKNPLPAIRDTKGVVRLTDNHHAFYAYNRLAGSNKAFELHVRIDRDYSWGEDPQGRRWSNKTMIADLADQAMVSISHSSRPTKKDFKSLPDQISELADSPERSLISFVFKSFDLSLKGKDFLPHIQNQLIERLIEEGIDPIRGQEFSEANVQGVADAVLASPGVLRFLSDNINPNLSPARLRKLHEFFEDQGMR